MPVASPQQTGGLRMAMYRLLRVDSEPAEGPSFSPEEVAQLTEAYEFVLASLELRDRDDPITELIAKKIIDLFARGERATLDIHDRTIKELGIAIRDRS